MPSYQSMYLVPRSIYDRIIRQENASRDNYGGNGDSLTGNVQGSAQVNHIEMAEGSKLTIKPSRAITADNETADGGEDDSRKRRAPDPAGVADRMATEREAELPDEDETDVPYVVGDNVNLDSTEDEDIPRAKTTDVSTQVTLPPVISGVSNEVQTQTDDTYAPRPRRSLVDAGTDPVPFPSRSTVTVETEPPAVRSSSASQTDPMAKFNLKDMSSLRRTAIKNWATIRRVQRGNTGEDVRSVPYAQLNDDVSMSQKIDMMRKILNAQIESIVGDKNKNKTPRPPDITSVTISPSSTDGTGPAVAANRLEDVIRETRHSNMPSKKIPPMSKGKVLTGVRDSAKRARNQVRAAAESVEMDQAKDSRRQRGLMRAAAEDVEMDQTIGSRAQRDTMGAVMDDLAAAAEEDDVLDRRRQRAGVRGAMEDVSADEEMNRLLEIDEEMPTPPTKASPPRTRRATRSQTKAKKDQDEERAMKEIIDQKLATLQGLSRRGKRAASEMGFPEEIEKRSGRSNEKKKKPTKPRKKYTK